MIKEQRESYESEAQEAKWCTKLEGLVWGMEGRMKLGNLEFKPMGAGQPLWGEGRGSSFSVGLVCLSEAKRIWAGVEQD